jgi:hypothetical protein
LSRSLRAPAPNPSAPNAHRLGRPASAAPPTRAQSRRQHLLPRAPHRRAHGPAPRAARPAWAAPPGPARPPACLPQRPPAEPRRQRSHARAPGPLPRLRLSPAPGSAPNRGARSPDGRPRTWAAPLRPPSEPAEHLPPVLWPHCRELRLPRREGKQEEMEMTLVGEKRRVPDKIRQKRKRTEEKGKTDFPRTYTRFQKTAGTLL